MRIIQGREITIWGSAFLGILLVIYTILQQFGIESALKVKIGFLFPVIAIIVAVWLTVGLFQRRFILDKAALFQILLITALVIFLLFFAKKVFPTSWFSTLPIG